MVIGRDAWTHAESSSNELLIISGIIKAQKCCVACALQGLQSQDPTSHLNIFNQTACWGCIFPHFPHISAFSPYFRIFSALSRKIVGASPSHKSPPPSSPAKQFVTDYIPPLVPRTECGTNRAPSRGLGLLGPGHRAGATWRKQWKPAIQLGDCGNREGNGG